MKILKFLLLGAFISAGGNFLFAAGESPPRTPTRGAGVPRPDSPAKVEADSAFSDAAIKVIRENYQACLDKKMISSPIEYLDLICDDILHLNLSQRQLLTAARMIQAIVTGHVFRVDPFRVANEDEKQIYLKAVKLMHKVFNGGRKGDGRAELKMGNELIFSPRESHSSLKAHLEILKLYNAFLNARDEYTREILISQLREKGVMTILDTDGASHRWKSQLNNYFKGRTKIWGTSDQGMISLPKVTTYNGYGKNTVHGFAQLLGVISP